MFWEKYVILPRYRFPSLWSGKVIGSWSYHANPQNFSDRLRPKSRPTRKICRLAFADLHGNPLLYERFVRYMFNYATILRDVFTCIALNRHVTRSWPRLFSNLTFNVLHDNSMWDPSIRLIFFWQQTVPVLMWARCDMRSSSSGKPPDYEEIDWRECF